MLTGLLKVEVGKETTWGTAVDPTAKLMLITKCTIKPGVKTERLMDEMRGTLYPAYTAYVKEIMPSFTLEGYVAAEDIPYLLDSFAGEATPSGTGPYVYAYSAASTAASSPRILTLVHGQASSEIYGLTGAIVNKLTFKMSNGSPWQFTAEGIGKNVLTDAFGSSLADRTVTLSTASSTTIYMDAAAGTIGSTSLGAVSAYEAEITLENKRAVDQYIGALAGGGHHEGKWDGSIKLHLELNNTTDELLEDQLVASPAVQARLFRFKYDNGGSTTASRIVQVDFAGVAEETPEIFKDKGGLVTFDWEAKGRYDTGAFASWFKASVTNNTSALV